MASRPCRLHLAAETAAPLPLGQTGNLKRHSRSRAWAPCRKTMWKGKGEDGSWAERSCDDPLDQVIATIAAGA